ncbi:MAG: dihydrodipicolinate synthase family protein [Chloroflexota bacterium]|nr:dihydrodipicolinate synthase family protein [Chloroflexota bacterium]
MPANRARLPELRTHLLAGQVIPAHPLALDERRRLDERHQRALTRYYVAAGAGGIAVGVHTTQFEIRDARHGLYAPVLALASETADATLAANPRPFIKVAGICGRTKQALQEAKAAVTLGYDAGLLSVAAWRDAEEAEILEHCRTIADAIPLFGFYLQPAVGGRVLSYAFWREFAEIPNAVAIKIAPFNRYQTLDVVRAVAASGRQDIALYTGNDDSIVIDLLTPFPGGRADGADAQRIVGGLLGHWAVWTHRAVELLAEIKRLRDANAPLNAAWLRCAAAITDANAALFDVHHNFAGCIPGIHEALRRQGLMRGTWCLDPDEQLSLGQAEEIDRVIGAYPRLTDDVFVAEHIDEWLR